MNAPSEPEVGSPSWRRRLGGGEPANRVPELLGALAGAEQRAQRAERRSDELQARLEFYRAYPSYEKMGRRIEKAEEERDRAMLEVVAATEVRRFLVKRYRRALAFIVGPSDGVTDVDLLEVYHGKGGGYEGLQEVARVALEPPDEETP